MALAAANAGPVADPTGGGPSRRIVLGSGLLVGAAGWAVAAQMLPLLPGWLRFATILPAFTLGAGSLAAGALVAALSLSEQVIVLCALGVGFAPLAADGLARAGVLALFPYGAGAGVGLWVARVWLTRDRPSHAGMPLAAIVPCGLALAYGAAAFARRLVYRDGGVFVGGDYDSVDLSYYAAITAELTHQIPPAAPFYAGHPLNYSWYPQLLLALVHRFGDVPVLDMYFRYAWPALLALGVLAGFVFVRRIASAAVATLAMSLLVVGGDFSYVFVWLIRPSRIGFDWLLWPTNFMAPTAEVLHFSTWTPSLPLFFGGLYALARAGEPARSRAWLALACAAFALLVQFKPFAFAVLMAALAACAALPFADRAGRRLFAATVAGSTLLAVPFLYQIVSLRAESRSQLGIAFFVLQQRMLEKLDLAEPFEAIASRIAPAGALHTSLVLAAATVLFFVGGLGVRWVAVRGVLRTARDGGDPMWRLLAWIALAGTAIPFVVVTVPYNDTLQFYQTALFVLWLFVARTLMAWPLRPAARALAVAAAIALAAPSPLHYLAEKLDDGPDDPRATLTRAERMAVDYLRTRDHETTVVLHDRPYEPSLIVVESERRSVLAWAPYVTGSEGRQRDIRWFFASGEDDEPELALELLRRYGVTHVIEKPREHLIHRAVLERLRPVLRFRELVLYEVPREFAVSGTPPRAVQ